MKFTPEEMAIDAADVDASKPSVIGRRRHEWQRFLSFKRGYVRLDSDVRKAFPTDNAVNKALRLFMKKNGKSATTRKKSA